MWIEKLDNGKFKCNERYPDYITGKKKYVSVTIEKDTKSALKTVEEVLRKKVIAKQSVSNFQDITLNQLTERFLDYVKSERKASTYRTNRGRCNAVLKLLGGDIIVSRLSAVYVWDRVQRADITTHSKNTAIKTFKTLMRWGFKRDYVHEIAYLDKLEYYQEEQSKPIEERFLEKNELSFLLENMDMPFWVFFTSFLALTGLRIGAAIALDQRDIDVFNKTISVNKNYDHADHVVTTPKNRSSNRIIYMQDELYSLCMQISSYSKRQKLLFTLPDYRCILSTCKR